MYTLNMLTVDQFRQEAERDLKQRQQLSLARSDRRSLLRTVRSRFAIMLIASGTRLQPMESLRESQPTA